MTPASDYLVSLAHKITKPYIGLPTICAAMVTGSSAKGLSDYYSDLDMTMYYRDELPPEEALHAIRMEHGAAERKWMIGDRAENSFAEAYEIDGIEVQIGHTTVAVWEETMAEVLERLTCDTPIQKALEGTLACQALYGDEQIEEWKAQIRAYPQPLAEAMVKKHLAFFPIWGLEHHFTTRDATLWYYQILLEASHNLMGVLAGLNRLYFTTFQFKRMGRFIEQMEITPPDFAKRLEAIFQQEMGQALMELETLVAETVALIERYMPTIETTQAKRRIGWRQQPWTPQV
ncbi:MAG: hypothetical protein AAF702_22615 [Chloroflexota bacterium]